MSEINGNDYGLWNKLTFKTTSYRKNFDLVYDDENFITEHEGIISELRMNESKPPFQIGEFQFSTWNMKFAKEFGVNLLEKLDEYDFEDSYNELVRLIKDGTISLDNINKLILLHTIIIHPDYRKRGVMEEFTEFMYRDFIYNGSKPSSNKNHLYALVKPIQNNPVDFDYFWNQKNIEIRESVKKGSPRKEMKAKDYYMLDTLIENDDTEINEYKLFSVATRCGFKRLGESYLFKFEPEKTIKRLKKKRTDIKMLNELDEWF